MWKAFPILLLLLAPPRSSAQGAAQVDSEKARILTLENAWSQALQQKDAGALELLLAPDVIYVEYDGTIMGKAEYLASVQEPTLHPERIVNESVKVHIYGGVAVVSGVCRESGVKNGKPYAYRERFTDTWIRLSQSWVCVASQATLIPH